MEPDSLIFDEDHEIEPNSVWSICRRPKAHMLGKLVLYTSPSISPFFELKNMNIGYRSQFISDAPIPVDALAFTGTEHPWCTNTVTVGDGLDLIVKNISAVRRRFRCRVHEDAAAHMGAKVEAMYPLGTSVESIGAGKTGRIDARASVAFLGKHIVLSDKWSFMIEDVTVGSKTGQGGRDFNRKSKIIGAHARVHPCTMDMANPEQRISVIVRNISSKTQVARAVFWGSAAL